MSPISEVEGLKAIDEVLSQIEDAATRERILRWAWAKFSPEEPPAGKSQSKRKARKPKAKKAAKPKGAYSMVKDLNLRPSGKTSLKDFVDEKQPSTNQEKCVVAVYYLLNKLGMAKVTARHVYTCFKTMNWRVPANLDNALGLVAFRKGWLDTSSMEDIKLTTHGDNLIEHDLPRKKDK